MLLITFFLSFSFLFTKSRLVSLSFLFDDLESHFLRYLVARDIYRPFNVAILWLEKVTLRSMIQGNDLQKLPGSYQ